MPDSATAKELTRPGASFARRYGLAFASVAGALLLDLLFRHFNLPHPLPHLHSPQSRSRFGTAAKSRVSWQFCSRL